MIAQTVIPIRINVPSSISPSSAQLNVATVVAESEPVFEGESGITSEIGSEMGSETGSAGSSDTVMSSLGASEEECPKRA